MFPQQCRKAIGRQDSKGLLEEKLLKLVARVSDSSELDSAREFTFPASFGLCWFTSDLGPHLENHF